jgi:hypothetical protein
MLDAFDCDVEALVLFFHLCPVLDDGLDNMGNLFENVHVHWKIILDSIIGWSLLLTSLTVTYVLQFYQYSQE